MQDHTQYPSPFLILWLPSIHQDEDWEYEYQCDGKRLIGRMLTRMLWTSSGIVNCSRARCEWLIIGLRGIARLLIPVDDKSSSNMEDSSRVWNVMRLFKIIIMVVEYIFPKTPLPVMEYDERPGSKNRIKVMIAMAAMSFFSFFIA